MPDFKWSTYQNAIFNFTADILNQPNHLLVQALAGTGKSTTIEKIVYNFTENYKGKRVLVLAFNKKAKEDLEAKLAKYNYDWKHVMVKTLDSQGLATVNKAVPGKGRVRVDASKGRKIANELAKMWLSDNPHDKISGLAGMVDKLATMAKNTLTDYSNVGYMTNLCYKYQICSPDEMDVVIKLACAALHEAKMDYKTVDFADMTWFPHVNNQWPWQSHLVIVDEAQDMNPAQLAIARKSVLPKARGNGRLIVVGDHHQAIYGWRGADPDFLPRFSEREDVTTLTLPETYRCAKNIVKEVLDIVPDYVAHDSNPDGVVREDSLDNMFEDAEPGDFILSRTNAPLLGIAMSYLKKGIPAAIQGRDIMAGLMSVIRDSETESIGDFLMWLDNYEKVEAEKLRLLDANDSDFETHHDKCECLRTLSVECDTTECLLDKLNDLFTDKDDSDIITLSTAHRAKGLERDRVWLLRETFKPNRGGEEANCFYVAVTRAKFELVYVDGV